MLARGMWHKSLTDEVITGAAERQMMSLDNPGFCLVCGLENDGCEPDARRYVCESCGCHEVYGAEELLLSISLPFGDDDEEQSHEQATLWPSGANRDGD